MKDQLITDEELMLRYQKGSEEAFRSLFERHKGKIFTFLLKKTNSETLASELTQEVFMKIHKSKSLYQKKFPVLPWFFTITRSVMIDNFRQHSKSKLVYDYDFETIADSNRELEDHPVELSAVEKAMEQLSPNHKAVIHMRYFQEKTFEEISQVLNTSPLNVRQIVSRGIKQIRNLLKGGPADEKS